MTVYNIYTRAIITSNYLITRRAHSAHLDGAVRVNLGCDAPGAGAEGDLGRGACKTDSQSSPLFIRTNDGRCLEPLWTPLTADNIPAWQVRGSNWPPGTHRGCGPPGSCCCCPCRGSRPPPRGGRWIWKEWLRWPSISGARIYNAADRSCCGEHYQWQMEINI